MLIDIVSQTLPKYVTNNSCHGCRTYWKVYRVNFIIILRCFLFCLHIKRRSNKPDLRVFSALKRKDAGLYDHHTLCENVCLCLIFRINRPIVTKNGTDFSHWTPVRSRNFLFPVLRNDNIEDGETCEAGVTLASLTLLK
jgi:hypothetical protein